MNTAQLTSCSPLAPELNRLQTVDYSICKSWRRLRIQQRQIDSSIRSTKEAISDIFWVFHRPYSNNLLLPPKLNSVKQPSLLYSQILSIRNSGGAHWEWLISSLMSASVGKTKLLKISQLAGSCSWRLLHSGLALAGTLQLLIRTHVTSPCGFGFLASWQPQSGHICYTVVRRAEESFPEDKTQLPGLLWPNLESHIASLMP